MDPSAYYGRDPESARYFRNLVNKFEVASTDADHEDGLQQRYYTLDDVVQPLKEKRVSRAVRELQLQQRSLTLTNCLFAALVLEIFLGEN